MSQELSHQWIGVRWYLRGQEMAEIRKGESVMTEWHDLQRVFFFFFFVGQSGRDGVEG